MVSENVFSEEGLDSEEVSRLRLLIVRLERRIRQQSATDLTPSQLSTLSVIERKGPLRLGELARRERISKSTITRVVNKLESRGHVELKNDPADGRCSVASITAQGQTLLDESRLRVDAYLASALGQITESQRQQVYAVIPVLESLLEKPR